jgi:PilZ domain
MALKTERRTQNRKRPLSLVYVELPPSNGGMMRDLSEQGFSLRAMMPLSPSEKIPFSFVLDTSARIEGEAIVLRIEDGGHVAALEFAGLPSLSRDQIRRWLDRFDEPLTPESAPTQPKESRHTSLTELRTQIRAPKPPSPVPPVGESRPQPSKIVAPPNPEPSPPPPAPGAEIAAPPPQKAVTPPNPEPPPAPISAILETPPPPVAVVPPKPETPLPPAAETPQPPPLPLPAMMALPKPSSPLPQEAPFPPVSYSRVEQPETPPLPPLLKLSSVLPELLPTEISAEPAVPATPAKPAAELPAKIQISLPKPEPPAPFEARVTAPLAAPPAVPRRVPPPLEPLSSFEGETDSDAPGWMDRFTLGRAIGIMLFLTLLAGSYVYHREFGLALIWLGHQIAGDDSSESSKVVLPGQPSASGVVPAPAGAARPVVPPPSLNNQQQVASMEPKSADLPAATDKTPSPQLKNTAPGSLVPLTQVARPPAPAAASPTDNAGQQEYLEALQILRSPSRASEVPAAVKLLWVSVEKGNTGAEIALAELFRTGKGVARNCDQTRILLSAAARKGSAEARKRLEEFRREGCSN